MAPEGEKKGPTTALQRYPRAESEGSDVDDALMAEGVVVASGLTRVSQPVRRCLGLGGRPKSGRPLPPYAIYV